MKTVGIDLLKFLIKETFFLCIIFLVFEFLPQDFFGIERPLTPKTIQHKKKHQSAYNHFSLKNKKISESFGLPAPKLNFVSNPRISSYYVSKTKTINFDEKEIYSPHADFTFYHEYAHFLQSNKRVKSIDILYYFNFIIIFYFLVAFLLRKNKYLGFLSRVLIILLSLAYIKKATMINEFYADSWAYSKIENKTIFQKYNIFNDEEKNHKILKNKWKYLGWFILDHPDFKTRKNIDLYPNKNFLDILVLDFKNYYNIPRDNTSFKESYD